MRRRHLPGLLVAGGLAAVLGVSAVINIGQPAQSSASTTPATASVQLDRQQQAALHDAMRKLWEEHVLWTRLFIVSDVAGLPDLQATTARLLANQSDIGNAVKPFYGTANGDHLTSLLMQHILQAAQILADARAGNTAALTQDEQAWYANANQIASFLHSLNPQHWPLAALVAMMKAHLDLTLAEAVDQLQGNYTASVAEFDSVENEILGMADTLSNGIIAQFSQNSNP
jgi:hypothetical protein